MSGPDTMPWQGTVLIISGSLIAWILEWRGIREPIWKKSFFHVNEKKKGKRKDKGILYNNDN